MALIEPAFEEHIRKKVTREYLKVFPHLSEKFTVHYCRSADGVKL